MLAYLRIKNFALLENVEMEFDSGLNIITGESGSGKSFIIKAIQFLLAHKMQNSIVRIGAEYASVEALFIHDNEEIILRRELSASSGRSRFFINDVLSSQESIKEIREELILYTSQHAQHKLLHPVFHTTLLDSFLSNEELIAKRDVLLQELRICRKKQEEIEQKYKVLAERRELLEFQQSEIERVSPSVEEEILLESQREAYKKAQVSIEAMNEARALLEGEEGRSLQEQLHSLLRAVQQIASTHEVYQNSVHTIEEMITSLNDIATSVREPCIPLPCEDIESIESRLFEFSKLKRLLHRNIEEICEVEHEIADNLSFLDSCELELKQLAKEEKKYREELQEVCALLTRARHDGATILSARIEEALLPLGFAQGCSVVFSFTPQEIWEECFEDKARITFCPNIGHPAMPLDAIASGGELSRFLLAISSIMSHSSSQTLIFDEVDTGIGGYTLQKVAEQLSCLGKSRQLIVITHWSAVARLGNTHFKVDKQVMDSMTTSYVLSLNGREREEELARMNID